MPTGAPLNVRVEIESSSSVFVSWQPPEQLEINGIITNYRVVIASASESKQYDLSANSTSGSFGGTHIIIEVLVLQLTIILLLIHHMQAWRSTLTTWCQWPLLLPLVMVHSPHQWP